MPAINVAEVKKRNMRQDYLMRDSRDRLSPLKEHLSARGSIKVGASNEFSETDMLTGRVSS